MDKVFRVELSGGNRRYCELDLPATNYELLDALERLQRKPGDKLDEHFDFHDFAHRGQICASLLKSLLFSIDFRTKVWYCPFDKKIH